jgi:hypothetical protein
VNFFDEAADLIPTSRLSTSIIHHPPNLATQSPSHDVPSRSYQSSSSSLSPSTDPTSQLGPNANSQTLPPILPRRSITRQLIHKILLRPRRPVKRRSTRANNGPSQKLRQSSFSCSVMLRFPQLTNCQKDHRTQQGNTISEPEK